MNGNDVLEFEEKNSGRLQEEFLKTKGIDFEDKKIIPTIMDLLETQEYLNFVLEEMHGE